MKKSDKTNKDGNWFARHKILTVILAIILLIIIVSVASGGDKSQSSDKKAGNTSSEKKDAKPKEAMAKIGTPVRDGKFEFTVHSIKCGEKQVGGQYVNQKAQGHFCRLNLSIKNIGNEAQTIDSSSQYLFNTKNQKYEADLSATIYASSSPDSSTNAWYDNINPGNTVKGDILFDVPKGVTPVTAELHDSAFSGGVKVALKK